LNSIFNIYLQLGYKHILDIAGYDHILFLVALCAIYKASEWKKVILLATAFTLGHSLTLALSALDILQFSPTVIEVLIPVTILLTAIFNMMFHSGADKNLKRPGMLINYGFAAIFGLIHGMGFSNFFRATALPGEENTFILQLFAFNVGVELGQIIIIAIILLAAGMVFRISNIKQKHWNWAISGIAAILAVKMIVERIIEI
jgi:hypothetical protein